MLRRIRTEDEIRREKKKKQMWLGGVMIALLVVAPLGYSLIGGDSSDPSDSFISEDGVDFYYGEGLWRFDLNGQVYGLTYLPSEVSDISVEGNYSVNDYVNEVIYFVDGEKGISEVLVNLERYTSRYQEACLGNETCSGDFPVKTCNDSLIIFEEANETKVYQNESCVYISGDQVKGVDAFLYKVLKVN
jgi:hypothetical protein